MDLAMMEENFFRLRQNMGISIMHCRISLKKENLEELKKALLNTGL